LAEAGTILAGLALTYLVNIPFGYWRAGTRRFSREWFIAVHAPVPIIVAYRLLAGVPTRYIPAFFAAYFLGQATGARLRGRR